jgi:hypothetical protein
MSWRELKLVLDAAPVRDTPLVILLALAEWSQADGVSWHPIEAIAARARCSVRRTRELLQGLAAPDANGRTLLRIRRAKRTTFYEINLDLLQRLDRETNGGQKVFPQMGDEGEWKSCESDEDDGGNSASGSAEPRPESAEARPKSANLRTPPINQKNQKEPEEPKNRPAGDTIVEAGDVVVIVKKLAGKVAFPPLPAALTEPQRDARQRFLDGQRAILQRKASP